MATRDFCCETQIQSAEGLEGFCKRFYMKIFYYFLANAGTSFATLLICLRNKKTAETECEKLGACATAIRQAICKHAEMRKKVVASVHNERTWSRFSLHRFSANIICCFPMCCSTYESCKFHKIVPKDFFNLSCRKIFKLEDKFEFSALTRGAKGRSFFYKVYKAPQSAFEVNSLV